MKGKVTAKQLETLQTVATGVALGSFVLGFLASIDVLLLPRGRPSWAWGIHPLLFLAGWGAGLATSLRGRQIDRRRWEILSEPRLTEGEREAAHHDAEQQRKWAGIWLIAAPILVGYWLAYQLADPAVAGPLTYTLPGTPLLGAGLGLVLTDRWLGPDEPPG